MPRCGVTLAIFSLNYLNTHWFDPSNTYTSMYPHTWLLKRVHLLKSTVYQGVIFDLDGTLMSSSLDFQAMRAAINCPPEQDILAYIDAMTCIETQQFAIDAIIAFELQDAQEAKVIDGVLDTLHHFKSHDLPLAIVTRNCRQASRIKVQSGKLPIDIILSREDAAAKPDPEALLLIANDWGLQPQQCLYVGDYLYDLLAAHNAGMASCLYAPNGLPHYHQQATCVIQDFSTLIEIVCGG